MPHSLFLRKEENELLFSRAHEVISVRTKRSGAHGNRRKLLSCAREGLVRTEWSACARARGRRRETGTGDWDGRLGRETGTRPEPELMTGPAARPRRCPGNLGTAARGAIRPYREAKSSRARPASNIARSTALSLIWFSLKSSAPKMKVITTLLRLIIEMTESSAPSSFTA